MAREKSNLAKKVLRVLRDSGRTPLDVEGVVNHLLNKDGLRVNQRTVGSILSDLFQDRKILRLARRRKKELKSGKIVLLFLYLHTSVSPKEAVLEPKGRRLNTKLPAAQVREWLLSTAGPLPPNAEDARWVQEILRSHNHVRIDARPLNASALKNALPELFHEGIIQRTRKGRCWAYYMPAHPVGESSEVPEGEAVLGLEDDPVQADEEPVKPEAERALEGLVTGYAREILKEIVGEFNSGIDELLEKLKEVYIKAASPLAALPDLPNFNGASRPHGGFVMVPEAEFRKARALVDSIKAKLELLAGKD